MRDIQRLNVIVLIICSSSSREVIGVEGMCITAIKSESHGE